VSLDIKQGCGEIPFFVGPSAVVVVDLEEVEAGVIVVVVVAESSQIHLT